MPIIPEFPSFGREMDISKPGLLGAYPMRPVEFIELAKEFGIHAIGHGEASSVYPINDHQVFAFNRGGQYAETPLEAKIEFYSALILHTLYPQHFPKMYSMVAMLKDAHGHITFGGTIRERVYFDKKVNWGLCTQFEAMGYYTLQELSSPMYAQVVEEYDGELVPRHVPRPILDAMLTWRANGIPLLLDCNKQEHFVIDREGRHMYMDMPEEPWLQKYLIWEPEKIAAFMNQEGYHAREVKNVERWVRRIMYLKERMSMIHRFARTLASLDDIHVTAALDDTERAIRQYLPRHNDPYPPLSEGDKKQLLLQVRIERYIQAH